MSIMVYRTVRRDRAPKGSTNLFRYTGFIYENE
jgi:hypothetical protein